MSGLWSGAGVLLTARCHAEELRLPQKPLAFSVGEDEQAVERPEGIEPSSEAWEAAVLPLNYGRIYWSG